MPIRATSLRGSLVQILAMETFCERKFSGQKIFEKIDQLNLLRFQDQGGYFCGTQNQGPVRRSLVQISPVEPR